ncbi:MAG: transporter [Clostridia bacterium]|nr:transporter [Clostridia bacterium]
MKKFKNLFFLHAIILLYAMSSICAKYASAMEFFSLPWFAVYALQILFLGIYALLWQQILKRMPLNVAFANKSVTLIWSMLFGVVLFQETLSPLHLAGAAIVLVGVILMVTEKAEKPDTAGAESKGETEGENDG